MENKGLPYGCDYAKTSRSHCKDADCKDAIDEGALRMSARTKSNFHDGLQDNWFHFDCFWKRARRGINEASIRAFEHLKWDDQEKVRGRIKQKEDDPDDVTTLKNARAEYAISGKSSCMECKEKLSKDEVRIEFRSSFFHPKCLANKGVYKKLGEEIDDFSTLEAEDQNTLRSLFTGPNANEIKKTEAGRDGGNAEAAAKFDDLEKRKEALKTQTNLIWEARAAIESTLASEKSLKAQKAKKEFVEKLIKRNGGKPYEKWSLDEFIQFLADIVVFGGFETCPECERTGFYYSPDRRVYQCAGASKENRCPFSSRKIKRKAFSSGGASGLKKYDGKQLLPEGRIFSKSVEEHAEEEKLILLTPAPVKKIDVSRKRKLEPEGTMKPNGFSIDPYFKQAEDFHVYVDEDGDPHQFLLHKAGSQPGDFKFYKVQLLEEDGGGAEWTIFLRYGVVQTETAKDTISKFKTFEDVLKKFKKMFHEKAGIHWEDRRKDTKPDSSKYHVVEWETNLAGSYGRTSAETQADENQASTAKQPKKEKKVKEEDSDEDDY